MWNELRAIYPMTLTDYTRMPAKPVTMLEGVYEGGEEYGYPITSLLVRREAYSTCLAGGFHGYGHNDSWRVKPTWRSALDDPGAQQMTVLKRIFTDLPEWWSLVPDQSVLTSGGNTNSDELNLAARSTTGKWVIAYIAGQSNITVNLTRIIRTDSASATWIDPVTGDQQRVGTFPVSGARSFTRPVDWQDAVLVVKAVDGSGKDGVDPTRALLRPPKAVPAKGPLRVHPSNPRYFTDGSGKAILLTGSHTRGNQHSLKGLVEELPSSAYESHAPPHRRYDQAVSCGHHRQRCRAHPDPPCQATLPDPPAADLHAGHFVGPAKLRNGCRRRNERPGGSALAARHPGSRIRRRADRGG